MARRRYVVGQPCPVPGHDHVLRLGSTARDNGGYVACTVRERERHEEWRAEHPVRKHAREDEAPDPTPAPPARDPEWDGAQACALVAEEDHLWAACIVAPRRFTNRAAAAAAAEAALQDVRSARARGRSGGRDD